MPGCVCVVCTRLFVFVSMGWKIEFGPCHGKKRGGVDGVLGGGWQHQQPKMKADNFPNFRVDEHGVA